MRCFYFKFYITFILLKPPCCAQVSRSLCDKNKMADHYLACIVNVSTMQFGYAALSFASSRVNAFDIH